MIKTPKYLKCFSISLPLALVAWILCSFLPGSPVYAAPILRLSISSGPVGTPITITGTVFQSYEGDSVHLFFDTMEIQTITIPIGGAFTSAWTISANATGGAHVIGAKGQTTDSEFLISAPFTVDMRQITLDVNQGKTGTRVNITGAGFYINDPVNISYFNTTAGNVGSVTASAAGRFSQSYTIPDGPAGFHQFSAANSRGNTAETSFKVLPNIALDQHSGAPGELVNISGSGFGPSSIVSISLGATAAGTATTDINGNFQVEITIPQLAIASYSLKTQDNLGNKVETAFPVTAGATLSETGGAVGNPVTVNGNGFQSGSTVTVSYDDQPVAHAVANSSGGFIITFTVPVSDGGDHTVNISDGGTTRRYTFAVETVPPPAPTPLFPNNNSITSAYTVFKWQPVTDPSLPVTYSLEIANDQNFSDISLRKEGLAETQYTLTGVEATALNTAKAIYFWRVMAIDGAGNRGGWSAAWVYSVEPPATPVISLPLNGASVDFPISLSWAAITSLSGPVTYDVQVSRNNEFTQLLIDEKDTTATLFAIPLESKYIFDKKIPYYWRVRAEDSVHNTSDWSITDSFNIVSPGFPAWAIITLVSLGAVVIIWLVYRFRIRKTYPRPE